MQLIFFLHTRVNIRLKYLDPVWVLKNPFDAGTAVEYLLISNINIIVYDIEWSKNMNQILSI